MAETKRIVVFYEGDDDKAVLESLLGMRLLPAGWEIAQRSKEHHPGKDGLVRQLLPLVRPVNGAGGSAVVLVDLDEFSVADTMSLFGSQLAYQLRDIHPPVALALHPSASSRLTLFELTAAGHAGRVVVVPVGLPDDGDLRSTYGIDRFAIDDHVLRLVRHPGVYEAVSELASVPFELAMRKLAEVAELFRKNGIEVRHSKRYVQILRAVGALRPATATVIGRLVRKACETLPPEELRRLLSPLLNDMEEGPFHKCDQL